MACATRWTPAAPRAGLGSRAAAWDVSGGARLPAAPHGPGVDRRPRPRLLPLPPGRAVGLRGGVARPRPVRPQARVPHDPGFGGGFVRGIRRPHGAHQRVRGPGPSDAEGRGLAAVRAERVGRAERAHPDAPPVAPYERRRLHVLAREVRTLQAAVPGPEAVVLSESPRMALRSKR